MFAAVSQIQNSTYGRVVQRNAVVARDSQTCVCAPAAELLLHHFAVLFVMIVGLVM
jgi:hypothetical protein